MKKIFTLLAALVMTMGAFAKDYTDTIDVFVYGQHFPQKATIGLDQNEDGTYNFSLRNFMFSMGTTTMPVGNVNLKNVQGVTENGKTMLSADQTTRIEKGDDQNVSQWAGPSLPPVPVHLVAEQSDDKLYAVIDINLQGIGVIKVVFGDGGYQIPGSDFENFYTYKNPSNIAEPFHWHSFASAGGSFASFVNGTAHTFESTDVRPGSTGKKSVSVKATSIFGIIANGTITTGRMNAGAISASDPQNHAELDMSNTEKDGNGDPFYTELNGRPDSLAVWVKFSQGTVNAAHPYATVSAIITDGTYYQDPEDKAYANKLAVAKNAQIATTGGEWKRFSIPFNYIDRSVNGKAILVTISTNADAGAGSDGDEVLIDDLSLIYNAPKATAITINGDAVEGFADGKTVTIGNVYNKLSTDDIVVTTDNENAKVFKTLEENDGTTTATIKVASNDLNNIATYTISLPGTTTGIHAIDLNNVEPSVAPTEIYNLNGQRVNNTQPGQVYIFKKGNKAVKVLK